MFCHPQRPHARGLIVALMLAILAGCSTEGQFAAKESPNRKAVVGKVAALNVEAPNSDAAAVASQLKGQVAAQLLGAGLFSSITGPSGEGADCTITVKLTKVGEVSGVSRVLFGVLAGRNRIEGEVTVTDAKTNQTLRSFSFVGESASHPFSGKSDIKDAEVKAAEEIMLGLK
jgi:Domain of unknown function (DUF4410)